MMVYISYIAFGFLIVQLIISIVNLIFIQNFDDDVQNQNDLVSILIPARNEEENIGNILSDLLNQSYRNIEIIVFNDESTDNTEKILKEFSLNHSKIKYINSPGLPKGWLGKNFACHSLSLNAKGRYFLFLDSDVRITGNLIGKALSYLKKHKLALLSIFPRQIVKSFGEKITVPLMNYILLTLLPLILVRKLRYSSLSAANGQFMLFDAEIYRKISPHEKMKNKRVEDIEIARFYKKQNLKIACVVGKDEISCRMYKNYRDAINGFAKNVTYFFGNSYLLAILFWLITSLGWLLVLRYLPFEFFIIYLIIFILIKVFVSLASKQDILENVLFSVIQQFTLGHIIFKSLISVKFNKLIWKGREI